MLFFFCVAGRWSRVLRYSSLIVASCSFDDWLFFLFNLILSSRVVWMRKKTFAAAAARLHCLQITVKDFHLTLYGFFFSVERIWMEIGSDAERARSPVQKCESTCPAPEYVCVNHKNFNRDVYIYRRVLFCNLFFCLLCSISFHWLAILFVFCLNSSY